MTGDRWTLLLLKGERSPIRQFSLSPRLLHFGVGGLGALLLTLSGLAATVGMDGAARLEARARVAGDRVRAHVARLRGGELCRRRGGDQASRIDDKLGGGGRSVLPTTRGGSHDELTDNSACILDDKLGEINVVHVVGQANRLSWPDAKMTPLQRGKPNPPTRAEVQRMPRPAPLDGMTTTFSRRCRADATPRRRRLSSRNEP